MGDWGASAAGAAEPAGMMAETLGRAMARRAAAVLARCQDPLTGPSLEPADGPDSDPERAAADTAIFDAVLAAANECLGRFDGRPAADRWCDALLYVLRLAEFDLPR